ncbi:transposase, partial [Streptomyces sp. MCAF7]
MGRGRWSAAPRSVQGITFTGSRPPTAAHGRSARPSRRRTTSRTAPRCDQGVSFGDHREVIDAIAFKFQTGTQWVHLPEKYGNWRGVYN